MIPILGLDPSFRHWGCAAMDLDMNTGIPGNPNLLVIETGDEPKGKQVRQNSTDINAALTLCEGVFPLAKAAKIVFVEVPHGSQSAAAMKGYGICIGVLAALRHAGIELIEVSEYESKMVTVGKRNATKKEMIAWAMATYPHANWPTHGKKVTEGKAEHMADALAAIHAGVKTPMFKNLLRLYAKA